MNCTFVGCYPTSVVLISNSGWGIASNGVAIVPIGVTKVIDLFTSNLSIIF